AAFILWSQSVKIQEILIWWKKHYLTREPMQTKITGLPQGQTMAILERYTLSKSKEFRNLARNPGILPLAPIINPVTIILSESTSSESKKKKGENENMILHHLQVKSLKEQLEKSLKKNSELESICKALGTNISSLYKTASAEIERKDRMISELRKEKDNIVFRRNRRKGVKKNENEEEMKDEIVEVCILDEDEGDDDEVVCVHHDTITDTVKQYDTVKQHDTVKQCDTVKQHDTVKQCDTAKQYDTVFSRRLKQRHAKACETLVNAKTLKTNEIESNVPTHLSNTDNISTLKTNKIKSNVPTHLPNTDDSSITLKIHEVKSNLPTHLSNTDVDKSSSLKSKEVKSNVPTDLPNTNDTSKTNEINSSVPTHLPNIDVNTSTSKTNEIKSSVPSYVSNIDVDTSTTLKINDIKNSEPTHVSNIDVDASTIDKHKHNYETETSEKRTTDSKKWGNYRIPRRIRETSVTRALRNLRSTSRSHSQLKNLSKHKTNNLESTSQNRNSKESEHIGIKKTSTLQTLSEHCEFKRHKKCRIKILSTSNNGINDIEENRNIKRHKPNELETPDKRDAKQVTNPNNSVVNKSNNLLNDEDVKVIYNSDSEIKMHDVKYMNPKQKETRIFPEMENISSRSHGGDRERYKKRNSHHLSKSRGIIRRYHERYDIRRTLKNYRSYLTLSKDRNRKRLMNTIEERRDNILKTSVLNKYHNVKLKEPNSEMKKHYYKLNDKEKQRNMKIARTSNSKSLDNNRMCDICKLKHYECRCKPTRQEFVKTQRTSDKKTQSTNKHKEHDNVHIKSVTIPTYKVKLTEEGKNRESNVRSIVTSSKRKENDKNICADIVQGNKKEAEKYEIHSQEITPAVVKFTVKRRSRSFKLEDNRGVTVNITPPKVSGCMLTSDVNIEQSTDRELCGRTDECVRQTFSQENEIPCFSSNSSESDLHFDE
ncbi:hypothetical protein L9F63_008967, partial [Diploptera punctata]